MLSDSNFTPVYTGLTLQEILGDRFGDVPFRLGQLITTSDDVLLIDSELGRTVYASLFVFDSLSDLNRAIKVTTKLYSVGTDLYRWDGNQLILLTASKPFAELLAGEYDEVTGWKAYQYNEQGEADYSKPVQIDVVLPTGCYPAYQQVSQAEYNDLPSARKDDGTLWLIEE